MPSRDKKLSTTPQRVKVSSPPEFSTQATKFRRSSAWRKYSECLRKMYPLCQNLECNRYSEEVHHIQTIQKSLDLALTLENTIPLCCMCHRLYDAHGTPQHVIKAWTQTTQAREHLF